MNRLRSLDVLRGFDMFFIIGGAGLVAALCTAFGCGDGWLARQMEHVPWAGLAHHDTIFPLFLFLAGVTWPISLASRRARGDSEWAIHLKVVQRAVTLFLIGLSFGGILRFDPCFRIPSVLGQIGLAWGGAALVYLHVKSMRGRLLVIAAILVSTWVVMTLLVAPDSAAGADAFARDANIISWLDRTLMPNHIYVKGVYDPESLFSVPNAVALALMGMCAGAVLTGMRDAPGRRVRTLSLAAVALLLLGGFFLFVLDEPSVKALWTGTFVLFAGAYSVAMLALFHWLIDIRGWTRGTEYFRLVGQNSITVYCFMMTGLLGYLGQYFFAGVQGAVGETWGGVVRAAGELLIGGLFVWFLDRKNIRLKV